MAISENAGVGRLVCEPRSYPGVCRKSVTQGMAGLRHAEQQPTKLSRYYPSSSAVKSTLSEAPRALLSRVVDEDHVTLAETCGYSIDFFSVCR